jgi:hypothetical protein
VDDLIDEVVFEKFLINGAGAFLLENHSFRDFGSVSVLIDGYQSGQARG